MESSASSAIEDVQSSHIRRRTHSTISAQLHAPVQIENSVSSNPLSEAHAKLLRRTSSFGGGPLVAVIAPAEVHQTTTNQRWIVLILACLLLFGNYYAYDNPAALNVTLGNYLGHDYDTWQYELNLLYSLYSFPNMFLPMVFSHII